MSGGSATAAFVATNTAAATAALVWAGFDWYFNRKVGVVGVATGAVAGLATVTPAAGFIGPMPAMVIGLSAGALCYMAIRLKNRLKLDDSLDVWAIHGVGGTWGMLATGLFVGIGFLGLSELTLEGMSRGEQIIRQLAAIGATWGWAFVTTMAILLVLKHTMGLRVAEQEEEEGLDRSQHGEPAYRT